MVGSLISLPRIDDSRGSLSFIESEGTVPFPIKRVYYLFDVGPRSERGSHAHFNLEQLIIAMSGSLDVVLDDGTKQSEYFLNDPSVGLLISKLTWRTLRNFSNGAVCCVLASEHFSEGDYIRDYEKFIWAVRQNS